MNTTTTTPDDAARQHLVDSLKETLADAEALLKTAQRSGGDQFAAAREKFEARLHQAKRELAALQEAASYNVRRAARVADTAVHEHPYVTAGVAAGIGVLVGMLISRR